MVKPTPENLQAAWQFVLEMQCGGSRNFIEAFRLAVENEQESNHNIGKRIIYSHRIMLTMPFLNICL